MKTRIHIAPESGSSSQLSEAADQSVPLRIAPSTANVVAALVGQTALREVKPEAPLASATGTVLEEEEFISIQLVDENELSWWDQPRKSQPR